MEKRQIINIINFIRGTDPFGWLDLETSIKEQINLMKKHNLRGTFLIMYDALINPKFVDMVKDLDPNQFELGVWFEMAQPLVERVGGEWKGRYPWDWHPNCGFAIGYSKEIRENMVDELYEKFKETFGYYPRVVGSWLLDSQSVRYITEKYGADAMCNCKEQFGTDGYTLWGGYYGQAYYPGRTNVFVPAQSIEDQLDVPMFRMLGSDPVYQYDLGLDPELGANQIQTVISLEPVYSAASDEVGGGVPEWVDWYMKENFNGDCLSFGYAQAGQENTFGWDKMRDGLIYQFAEFERLQKEGKIEVETIGESGRWYKNNFSSTPASAIVAHTAYDDPDRNSVWYCSKYYRINLYGDHGKLRIRDLHIFSGKQADAYDTVLCPGSQATYETLPVVDGNRHTAKGIIGGAYIKYSDGTEPTFDRMVFTDNGDGTATVAYGDISFMLCENAVCITAGKPFGVEAHFGTKDHLPRILNVTDAKLDLEYAGTNYSLCLEKGRFVGEKAIMSSGSEVYVKFEV